MLFSHATSCYQVTPLQAIFPISRSFRWKQNVFFSPGPTTSFKAFDMTRGKRDFDVWNRWIFPYRSTPSGRWRTLLALREAISVGFFFSMQSFYFKRSNFTDSHARGTRHCYIVGRGLPAKGPCYILLSQNELWSGERLKSLRTKTTSA